LGGQASAGLGWGLSGGGGTALILGWDGFETAMYSESGGGIFFGAGASYGAEITISPFAMKAEDMEGSSVNYNVKAVGGVQLGGITLSFGLDEEGNADLWDVSVSFAIPGLGGGLEASASCTWTETVLSEAVTLPDVEEPLAILSLSHENNDILDWDTYDKYRGV
jgi:hypothetical protein